VLDQWIIVSFGSFPAAQDRASGGRQMCVKYNLADVTYLFTLHSVTLKQSWSQIAQKNLLQESQTKQIPSPQRAK